MPKTRWGKWSVGLIAAMVVLFFAGTAAVNLLYPAVRAGNSLGEDMARRPALALAMLGAVAAGTAAFAAAVVAIVRRRERSPLVYAAAILGAMLLGFLLGELWLPH